MVWNLCGYSCGHDFLFRSVGMFYDMLQIDIVSCMPMVLAHENDFGEYSS